MTLMNQNIQKICTCTSSANAQGNMMLVTRVSVLVLLGIKVFKLIKTK